MTYTEAGREFLLDHGDLAPESVVAIGNATDSAGLRSALSAVTAEEVALTSDNLGLRGSTALFVGGLDESKRIPLLVDAALAAGEIDRDFRLIVVGMGEQSALVDRHVAPRGPIVRVPTARGRDLAVLGAVATAMWMPGRVGLVAVDALALGLPVFTTPYPFHAPEIEFLSGENLAVLPDHAVEFARAALALMARGRIEPASKFPTIDSVALAFADTVQRGLMGPTRGV